MNKYIVPICDIQAGEVWVEVIPAASFERCKEMIMAHLIEYYDKLPLDDTLSYHEFVKELDKHDILIGDIKDIEEL